MTFRLRNLPQLNNPQAPNNLTVPHSSSANDVISVNNEPSPTTAAPTLPRGVMLSPQSGHPVTSWGLRAMDLALSGGIPLSTLTLIGEDTPTSYHLPFMNYVTAQGIQHGHAVAVASFNLPSDQIIDRLPSCISATSPATPSSSTEHTINNKEMKIAWRYQRQHENSDKNKVQIQKEQLLKYTSDFDLSQKFDTTSLSKYPLSMIPVNITDENKYTNLLTNIHRHLQNAKNRKLFSRILIYNLQNDQTNIDEITQFLTSLRYLSRVYGCIILVSYNINQISHSVCRTASDALLSFDSFNGQGTGVAGLGSEWLAIMTVKKIYRLSFASTSLQGRGDVWVFKRGRRKYTMERATAAPDDFANDNNDNKNIDLDDIDNNKQSNSNQPMSSVICGTGPGKSSYEF